MRLDSLADQRPPPLSQQTHIPAPGKTVRTKHQLQPSSLSRQGIYCTVREHAGLLALFVVSPKHAKGHYLWFHRRMPEEHQQQALYQFDIDVHLRESLQHDKLLSSLISAFCTLADSELIPSTTQLEPNWTNAETVEPLEKFFIWQLISKDNMSFQQKSQYHSPCDFNQILHWELLSIKEFFTVSFALSKINCTFSTCFFNFSWKKQLLQGCRKHRQLPSWLADSKVRISMYKIWTTNILIFLWPCHLRASSAGWFDGPLVQLENLGPWTGVTGPLFKFKLPSPLKGDTIVAKWSRQKRDSVSQTPGEGDCWHW